MISTMYLVFWPDQLSAYQQDFDQHEHDVTISTLSTASWQYRFPHSHIYYIKKRVYHKNWKVTILKGKNNYINTWFCSKIKASKSVKILIHFIILNKDIGNHSKYKAFDLVNNLLITPNISWQGTDGFCGQ